MKRYIIIFLIPVLTAISFSCQDRLDIVPNQSLAPELALQTEGDLVALLVGAYDGLQSVDLYGGGIQMMADIWANRYYLRFRGTFNYLLQIASVTSTSNFILTDNAGARDIWADAYRAINICNLVLANLSLSEGNLRPTSSVEGEALFIRGSLYFELARLYGRAWGDGDENVNLAVPIILMPTPYNTNDLTPANYPDRSSVAEVYAQALSDLEAAADLLPETNQYYATKWAAYAQLSRIALMQEDYAAARDYANMVIESNRFSLTDQFSNLWYNYIRFGGVAPLEYIFYVRISTQDGTNGLNTYYGQTIGSIPGSAGRGDLDAQATWRNRYDVNDARRFYVAGSSGRQLTQKHIDRFGHVPVIRLAEMYLTRAEGNFREGTSVGATPFDDINTIRERAGISLLADPGDLTIDLILEERELELAYEGHYLHDLKRTRRSAPGSNPDPVAGNPVPWDSPKLIFPIPQREVDVNPNLIQNEGYD